MKTSQISRAICLIYTFLLGIHAQAGSNATGSKESAPNPLFDVYPEGITGTQNSTIFVVPIPFELARSLIPQQWGINRKAYCELLPGFPTDSYPLVVRSGVDHDIGVAKLGFKLDDFQFFTTLFPFVDFVGDGYSNFAYKPYLLLSKEAEIAINATREYGIVPIPATFSPSLEAYAYAPSCNSLPSVESYFTAYSDLEPRGTPQAAVKFTSVESVKPWPIDFYVNATNQPVSGDGTLCDNQIFLYNTTISTGDNAPRGVKGSVTLRAPLLPQDSTFHDVFGVRVDTAFLEKVEIPCAALKGYYGTGPGDRGTGSD
ncbi:uncharacterized protein RCO7_06036 [Rhynchosporium graminicola]|uniref:Uncharacterized protein n=1 Tax=Rhynchosporium graminicola TaxID=2792576 RepID=A0A1E1KXL6_9HELO|nr:uncharacterized protein RCO7_06036 [Rhynchosporium commune]